uniref:NADH-ubiquinone oxidoreductase chain 3 n=1 Tax=Drilaster sp. FM16 TaxID=2596691 RepID=A0A5C0PWH3_9COLE|nr:NADH dehydrogenase subunit 3 [Drilaster sp. FM16]
MIITLITATMIILLSMLIMMIANLTSMKTIIDREKSSPFECGFDPKTSARLPFSLQFFLIAVIFLIFDVEITLLLPLIMILKITNITTFALVTSLFLFILLIGLYHEWKQGALDWGK